MPLPTFPTEIATSDFKLCHDHVELQTRQRVQFIDLTELVLERVRRSKVQHGTVNVQTKHTTTGIVVNENERHLLRDFEDRLEFWAPRDKAYRHNDLEARRFQLMDPDEQPNGDSHSRALLLGASETLNILDGAIDLGRWQRVFLVELDGGRVRTVSLVIMGTI